MSSLTIPQLKELLDSARSNAYEASDSAESASSYASQAESRANDLYYELDKLADRIDDLVGFNPEALRDIRTCQKVLMMAAAYAGRRVDAIIDGDGSDIDSDSRWTYLTTIIGRIFDIGSEGKSFEGFDKSFGIEYDLGTGAYMVSRKKEENNG